MKISKRNLIDSLHKVLCTCISRRSDSKVENNDYFKRRVLGFRAEIELEEIINNHPNYEFLEGGQFITKKSNEKENQDIIYTTISYDPSDKYKDIYKIICRWDQVSNLYFLQIKTDNFWRKTNLSTKIDGLIKESQILMPEYNIFKYIIEENKFERIGTDLSSLTSNFEKSLKTPSRHPLRKREQFEYFNEYSIQDIKKIYANRYFIDVFLRGFRKEGLIDIDGFLSFNKKYKILEIKEKSPIKNKKNEKDILCWEYGWDSRRVMWFYYLKNTIKLDILYCIRRINNREDRIFEDWDSISLENFLQSVNWSKSVSGGGGESTQTVSYQKFSRLIFLEPNNYLNK
ncbi:hypothetical protein [Halobacteriovorax sp. RT-2-4]|uniref:hypothetical protein n=1 Tax=unclassified Halobacteriovorax TaxID=2639665 RepID=UPI00399ADC43